MAKKEKQQKETPVEETVETPVEEAAEVPETETVQAPEVNPWEEKYNAEHDAHLRLAAEYDNYRKRTMKEKEGSYLNGKADAVEKLLPVYDNLERALNQPTEDEAFKKGVEMTMTQLVSILESLGVEIFGNMGDTFDPNLHNAVMHTEDAAYKKGVEMTMNELVKIFTGLGVEVFGTVGEEFNPELHNAVMHTENADVAENTITQVFQKGFKLGDKIVRFAMVQVAN